MNRTRAIVSAIAAGALSASMLFSAVGCSSQTTEESSELKVLNVASSAYAIDASLDPLDGSWNYCYVCYEGIAETLFRISDDWTPEPWLATEAEPASDDYTTWTITLRDDVTYHNGNAMTAETVQTCLQRAMDESEQARGIIEITDMEADGQTLTITLAQPCYDLASELCNSVFVIYDEPADGDYANSISYTGPFMLTEHETSVSKTTSAYENYWRGTPLLDEVHWIAYADDDAALLALQSGEVDFVMSVPFSDISTYENDPDYTVSYADPNSIEMIYFNENHTVSSDSAIKEAIALALDRETICEDVYYGYAKPMYTIFDDELFSYGGTDGLDLTVTGYDLERAAEVLADGGWADTDGDGILDKDGNAASLSVVAYPDTYILGAAEILTTACADLGIELTITATYDYTSYEQSGDFDMIWTYEGVTRSGTPTYFLSTFLSTDGSGNYGGFSSASLDEAVSQLTATSDPDEIKALVQQAEQAVADDGHMIPWAMRAIPFVYSSDVTFTAHAYRYYMIDETTDIAQ